MIRGPPNVSASPRNGGCSFRRGTQRSVARDYARALLLNVDENGKGLRYSSIARKVKHKFPEYTYLSAEQLAGLALYLSKQFKLPPRP